MAQSIGSATISPAPVAGWMVDWRKSYRVVPTYHQAVRLACRMGFSR